jgi:pimeloyl-ACP methyl ester carboxylesterase
MSINAQSHMIILPGGEQLHLRRYRLVDSASVPIVLLHGLHEDGTLFYSRTGRGLAPYLAQQGYDVWVPDLRGKGRSWPSIEQLPNYSVQQTITEDLPAVAEEIARLCQRSVPLWLAHGAGGVLLSGFLARYPEWRAEIKGLVYVGCCRVVVASGWQDRLRAGVWGPLSEAVARVSGVVPAQLLGYGVHNESLPLHQALLRWSQGEYWVDPVDGFDYAQTWREQGGHPPVLYFASRGQPGYGNAAAVAQYMRELGHHDGRLVVLGRREGNLHNYTHISMLTHADAERDHFPFMLRWLRDRVDSTPHQAQPILISG